MRVVLDTNVLISGAFFGGLPGKIVDACMSGRLDMAVSREIVVEYRRVGEEFTGTNPNRDFNELLELLLRDAVQVEPSEQGEGVCRDPDDDKFISCAVEAQAVAIISGDRDLLEVGRYSGVEVLTPRGFTAKYLGGQRS